MSNVFPLQPQYPSNIFLLNSKNGTEKATSSKKRGREAELLFSLQSQSQPPHLIDTKKLHTHQHNNSHQQLMHNLPQHSSHSSPFFSLFSQVLNSQIKQHQHDIDHFLQAKGEELRHEIAVKRQKHYETLIKAAEETVARRLKEKEVEVEKATRRKIELEARAAQLTVETQILQAKVKAQVATAASLKDQLHHAIKMSHKKSVVVEDAESALLEGQHEDAESAYVDPNWVMVSGPICRGCDIRVASVVVLPCRHLCVCTKCDNNFRACPVCLTLKNSSLQVSLS